MKLRRFKLIKEYPGSANLGDVFIKDFSFGANRYVSENKTGRSEQNSTIENFPEYFEEIVEYCPYQLHYIGDKITGVTRLTDNIYFSRGLRIKRPNSNDLGFIYDFKIINNVLHIEHTFSYLMNKEGYIDQLKYLRPCIYTKEDLIK